MSRLSSGGRRDTNSSWQASGSCQKITHPNWADSLMRRMVLLSLAFLLLLSGIGQSFGMISRDEWASKSLHSAGASDEQTLPMGETEGSETDVAIQVAECLSIYKTVTNADGSELDADQLMIGFELTVTFSDGGSYAYSIDGGRAVELSSGSSLTLRHGQLAVFEQLPAGLGYTVSEAAVHGYRASSSGHQGNIAPEGCVAEMQSVYVAQTGSLTISMQADGLEAPGDSGESGGGKPGADKLSEGGVGADDAGERLYEFTVSLTGLPEHPITITVDGEPVSLQPDDCELTIQLENGQQAVIDKLPAGTGFTVSESDLGADGLIALSQSYSGQVAAGPQELPFTKVGPAPLSRDGASLEVSKTLLSPLGMLTTDQLGQSFEMTVTFSDLPDEPVEINVGDEPAELSEQSCEFQVTLKHGESLAFTGLPSGISYEVVEAPLAGYLAVVGEVRGSVAAGSSAEAAIVNTVDQQALTPPTALTVQKAVAGPVPDGDAGRLYAFVLELEGSEPLSFALRAGEAKVFTNLQPGLHYNVTEVDYYAQGYALVAVSGGSGTLLEEPTANRAVFTNAYLPEITVGLAGQVRWDLNGQEASLPESVFVQLWADGVLAQQIEVRENDEGVWAYSFTAPKYGAEGALIDYSVDQLDVLGFEKAVDGLEITNVLRDGAGGPGGSGGSGGSGGPSGPGGPASSGVSGLSGSSSRPSGSGTTGGTKLPFTGDISSLVGWATALVLAAIGLVALAIGNRQRQMRRMREAFGDYGNWRLHLPGDERPEDIWDVNFEASGFKLASLSSVPAIAWRMPAEDVWKDD